MTFRTSAHLVVTRRQMRACRGPATVWYVRAHRRRRSLVIVLVPTSMSVASDNSVLIALA